jgi:hypothetical protein
MADGCKIIFWAKNPSIPAEKNAEKNAAKFVRVTVHLHD